MLPHEQILQAVTVAAELTGTQLSDGALATMVDDLMTYPLAAVLTALDRCRRELTGRLTLAAVVERLNGADGRPGADEAWAIAIRSQPEAETVVWTNEIAEAFAVCRPVLDLGDEIGARMAFRDAYNRIIAAARAGGEAARWSASLGWDKDLRQVALESAARTGRLAQSTVAALMPPQDAAPEVVALIGKDVSPSGHEGGLQMARAELLAGKRRRAEREVAAAERRRQEQTAFEAERQRQLSMAAEKLGRAA
ncbi:hypothetical protein GCM10027202_17590 [Microvirgula curvata]